MKRNLRVAVGDDEPQVRAYLCESLVELGHDVVISVGDGRELVEKSASLHPDLVIADIRMPSMDGIDAATEICRQSPVPVILVSAYPDSDLVERAENSGVSAYLVKPITGAQLGPAIALATRRFDEMRALRQETAELRQTLEDRKVIERAKGMLMRAAGLDEKAAFSRLQRLASQKSKKLVEAARMLLAVESVFDSEV